MPNRCNWSTDNELMIEYHDKEWGSPQRDDTALFEFLCLEGAQAGLSWQTILNRREGYRKAFFNFDVVKVSKINEEYKGQLLENKAIIRNRLKIDAFIANANLVIEIQKEYGSFEKYIWQFVNNKPIVNKFSAMKDIPPSTDIAQEMSKTLKKYGFKFIGPTICYAFMQATGMVNDHIKDCFRYKEVMGD